MSTTWYKTNSYNIKITPVEVVSETAQYVTRPPSESYFKRSFREAKGNDYHRTFAEARTYLLDRTFKVMQSHELIVINLKKDWETVFMLEPPKEVPVDNLGKTVE